jgi:N-acetylglucosamine-6-phosphate deacetylase
MIGMSLSPVETIDLHLHGIDGYDTKNADPQSVARIAECEGRAGVSQIVLSICSGPVPEMRHQIDAVRQAMKYQTAGATAEREGGDVDSRGVPSIVESQPETGSPSSAAARILGVHLEGPFLNPIMAGALDGASFLIPGDKQLRELTEGFEGIIRTITIAPEMEGALPLIKRTAGMGILVNMGHSNATFQEAKAGFQSGARGITHLFNAMRRFHHREPGLVGFGLLNEEVYVELIADLSHISKEVLQLVCRVKNPDRMVLVSDSVKETSIAGGRIPLSEDGRLLGGAATLTKAASRLIKEGFDKELVTRLTSANPSRFLGLPWTL